MPAGPGPIGFIAFAAVKAGGYTAACGLLKHMYDLPKDQPPSAVALGLTRTAVGIAVGITYGLLWINLMPSSNEGMALYYSLLLPIRFAEWSLVLWWFLGRDTPRDLMFYFKGAAVGTICSYLLDAAGVVAALVVPGGFWIC